MRQMKRSDQLKQSPVVNSDSGYMERVKFDDQASDQVALAPSPQVQQDESVRPSSPSSPLPQVPPATSQGDSMVVPRGQAQSAMGQLYPASIDAARHVQHQGRPFMPMLYEPLGFPPRFYRMQL